MSIKYDYGFENYHEDIFNIVHEIMDDHEVLKLGIEIIKIATGRLDSDLNNKEILKEYILLRDIIDRLEKIDKNYV